MSSRARFQPTLPAPTIRTYISLSGNPFEADLAPHRRLEQLDRGLRRADRLKSLLRVPARPRRVEHAHHDPLHVEAALRDLRDDQIGVVSIRGGDESVRLLDPAGEEGVDLERGALGEAAPALLPPTGLAALEQRDGLGVLVQDRDLVALGEHRVGDGAAYASAADDQNEHSRSTLVKAECSGPSRSHAFACPFFTRRRRGEDDLAGGLLDDVASGVADKAVTRPAPPAEDRSP